LKSCANSQNIVFKTCVFVLRDPFSMHQQVILLVVLHGEYYPVELTQAGQAITVAQDPWTQQEVMADKEKRIVLGARMPLVNKNITPTVRAEILKRAPVKLEQRNLVMFPIANQSKIPSIVTQALGDETMPFCGACPLPQFKCQFGEDKVDPNRFKEVALQWTDNLNTKSALVFTLLSLSSSDGHRFVFDPAIDGRLVVFPASHPLRDFFTDALRLLYNQATTKFENLDDDVVNFVKQLVKGTFNFHLWNLDEVKEKMRASVRKSTVVDLTLESDPNEGPKQEKAKGPYSPSYHSGASAQGAPLGSPPCNPVGGAGTPPGSPQSPPMHGLGVVSKAPLAFDHKQYQVPSGWNGAAGGSNGSNGAAAGGALGSQYPAGGVGGAAAVVSSLDPLTLLESARYFHERVTERLRIAERWIKNQSDAVIIQRLEKDWAYINEEDEAWARKDLEGDMQKIKALNQGNPISVKVLLGLIMWRNYSGNFYKILNQTTLEASKENFSPDDLPLMDSIAMPLMLMILAMSDSGGVLPAPPDCSKGNPTTLFRGMKGDCYGNVKAGQTFTVTSMMSLTGDFSTAVDFAAAGAAVGAAAGAAAGAAVDIVCTLISLKFTSRGDLPLNITSISEFPDEEERVLRLGTVLRVHSVEKRDKVRFLNLSVSTATDPLYRRSVLPLLADVHKDFYNKIAEQNMIKQKAKEDKVALNKLKEQLENAHRKRLRELEVEREKLQAVEDDASVKIQKLTDEMPRE
jgi:hypothetical protein